MAHASATPPLPTLNLESRGEEAERIVGSPFEGDHPGLFRNIVAADEAEEFPEHLAACFDQMRMHEMMIPLDLQGHLIQVEQMIEPAKAIGRRDTSALIAKTKNYLGSLPLILFGTPEQKQRMAEIVRAGGYISLGLTEKTNGSDLLNSQALATRTDRSWKISGEKWLVNNITNCDILVLLARSEPAGGVRGFGLFALEPERLFAGSIERGRKIRTFGLRGMRLGSMRFNDAEIRHASVVGHHQRGFEQVLKALQISRALCSFIVLGPTETALRMVTEFCLRRVLYGKAVSELPITQHRLAESYATYQAMEVVSYFAARAISVFPDQLAVWTPFVKNFVTTSSDRLIQDLAVTLGARYFLREGWCSGVFQKILRDTRAVSLFDGSTVVNEYVLNHQLPIVLKAKSPLDSATLEKLRSCFDVGTTVDLPGFAKLLFTAKGSDFLLRSLANLEESSVDPWTTSVVRHLNGKIARMESTLARLPTCTQFEPERYQVSRDYCLILAVICLLWNQSSNQPLSKPCLEMAVEKILNELLIEAEFDPDYKQVYSDLSTKVKTDRNLGLLNYPIARWFQANKEWL